jgi:RHS repeat-associated protein
MTSSGQTTSYGYNQLDQLTVLTQTGGIITNFAYDVRGNLTTATQGGNSTTYTWDKADRLTGVTLPGSGGSQTYKYDHANRRVQVISGTNTTNYLWDEQSAYGDVLIEADNSWNVQTSYTLGNGELIGQNRSSTLSYYLMDGHSGVRGLTDASGSLTDSYAYGAFGDLKNSTGTTANNYRYTGQQFDSLTGLYSLRARYYNPSEGRFLSRDTWDVKVSNPIEINRYVYVANNPITFDDPRGLFVEPKATAQVAVKATPAIKWLGYIKYGIIALSIVTVAALGFVSKPVLKKDDLDPECEKGNLTKLCLGLGLGGPLLAFQAKNPGQISIYNDFYTDHDFAKNILNLMAVAKRIYFVMEGVDPKKASNAAYELLGWGLQPFGEYTSYEVCQIMLQPLWKEKTTVISKGMIGGTALRKDPFTPIPPKCRMPPIRPYDDNDLG